MTAKTPQLIPRQPVASPRKPTRRETIAAIVSEWGWSRAAATHAVDVWGFYPWKLVEVVEG